MLRFLLLALCLLPFTVMALEIHCQSDIKDLEIVVIRSPKTQILYLVPLMGDQANPIKLADLQAKISDTSFSYQDQELTISIDGVSGAGEVLVAGQNPLKLNSCQFISTDSIE